MRHVLDTECLLQKDDVSAAGFGGGPDAHTSTSGERQDVIIRDPREFLIIGTRWVVSSTGTCSSQDSTPSLHRCDTTYKNDLHHHSLPH